MCGIAGVVLKSHELAEKSVLEQMASSMVRRGPDGQGIFINGNVGLAHRRLKVIDLSTAADQPLFNSDGRIGIVFNGEVYNFLELRSELEAKGHRFKSNSDTEVIVHAFEAWGTAAFRRFNGMFAFALWDGRVRDPILYLVRDRFGIKPLFFTKSHGRLAFSSELKALLSLDWVQREVNPQTLYHFLKFSHVPQPSSILEGIEQLAPGSWLRFSDGKLSQEIYWDVLELTRQKSEFKSESEALEELEAVLLRSAKRQLVSDVPLGCFLSGGIDSSLLVAASSALGVKNLSTFTIGYRDTEFDESKHALEIATAFKTQHQCFIAKPEDYFDLIPDIPTYFDQPLGDPTILSSLLLSKFARSKVTVALSGDGGDELFFGYPYQKALLHMRAGKSGASNVRKLLFRILGDSVRHTSRPLLQKFAKAADVLQFSNEAEMFQYFIGTFGPLRMDRLAELLNSSIVLDPPLYGSLLEKLNGVEWRQKIEQVFLRTFMTDTVLAKTDRAGMAFGLEARVPFLDDEIVGFSSRLPFSMKLKAGNGKYLLRKLLEKNLKKVGGPTDLSFRKKKGFSIPLRDWLRTDLKYLLDENLNRERIKREGLLNPDAVAALVREHLEARANHSHLLWSMVSFQMWKERYLP